MISSINRDLGLSIPLCSALKAATAPYQPPHCASKVSPAEPTLGEDVRVRITRLQHSNKNALRDKLERFRAEAPAVLRSWVRSEGKGAQLQAELAAGTSSSPARVALLHLLLNILKQPMPASRKRRPEASTRLPRKKMRSQEANRALNLLDNLPVRSSQSPEREVGPVVERSLDKVVIGFLTPQSGTRRLPTGG